MDSQSNSTEIQHRLRNWVESRLGKRAMARHERAMRMLEEAIELAQALGVSQSDARRIWIHVYSKPPGAPEQELGGAALTLLACAEGCGFTLSHCAEKELCRIESLPQEKFRKRQALNASLCIGAKPE
jgi:hypothetical protein